MGFSHLCRRHLADLPDPATVAAAGRAFGSGRLADPRPGYPVAVGCPGSDCFDLRLPCDALLWFAHTKRLLCGTFRSIKRGTEKDILGVLRSNELHHQPRAQLR